MSGSGDDILVLSAGDQVTADAVESIPTSAYPTPAARPANSLLDSSLLERRFGYRMPDWREDLVPFVRRLA